MKKFIFDARNGIYIIDLSKTLAQLEAACAFLAEVVDSDTLSDWNDAPGRTQADVLAALAEAGVLPAEIGNR